MTEELSKGQREALLQRRRVGLVHYNRAMERSQRVPPASAAEMQALGEAAWRLSEAEAAEREYFEQLPRLTVSCCPFDGQALYRSFDAFGFDGPWWRPDAAPEEAPACPHFCVLAGAVRLGKLTPPAGDFDVYPGPEAPYVIPRLMETPSMVAVIGEVEMENGGTAYPIAYFAERKPPPQDLTAHWPRTNYVYTTQAGDDGWRLPDDRWDFDLRPWLAEGKVRWCAPASDNTKLSSDDPERCPYLNAPGERQRRVLRKNQVLRVGSPADRLSWFCDFA